MALQTLTFQQFVGQLQSVYSSIANKPANVGVGSALGSVFNAVGLLSLNLQQQTYYNNNITRLATSTGSDVDTFVNAFGVYRFAAVAATNSVIYTLNSVSGFNTFINPGTVCQTALGIQFTVVADTTQANWSVANNAYVIAPGNLTAQVTVVAVVPGISGNVNIGTINQLVSVPGIPAPAGFTVNNVIAFTNGTAGETDAALIARFQSYMSNRFATIGSIQEATSSFGGLTYSVLDMQDQYGNYSPNFFSVLVNIAGQNSGPTSAVINEVYNSVLAVRPAGMPFQVVGPVLVPVNVSGLITLVQGAISTNVINAVITAVATYINNIGLNVNGGTTDCSFSEITSIIINTSGVANITGLQLNGGISDITASTGQQMVSGSFTFTSQ